MIRRDAHSKSKVLAFVQANNSTTADTGAIDIRNYMCVEVVFILDGNATAFTSTNKLDVTCTESTTSNGTFTDCPVDDFLGVGDKAGAGVFHSFQDAHATAKVYRFGYRGDAGYLKVGKKFASGYTTNRNVSIVVMGMDPWDFPTDDQNS